MKGGGGEAFLFFFSFLLLSDVRGVHFWFTFHHSVQPGRCPCAMYDMLYSVGLAGSSVCMARGFLDVEVVMRSD